MSTLNAKANAAYNELIAKTERENPGDVWAGFDGDQDAFETGFETGYEAAPGNPWEPQYLLPWEPS